MEKIIAVTMAALVSAVIWYLKYQAKTQTEREKKHDEQQVKREEKHDKIQEQDRKLHRDLIMNHLTGLQKTGEKNTALQENLIKHMDEHDNYCKEASKKIIESFDAICDKINGKNSKKVSKKNG